MGCQSGPAAVCSGVNGVAADLHIAELYRAAGLVDVVVEARATVYPPGHSRRTAAADVVRVLRPRIIALGVADADELDALDAAARTHVGHPDTIVMPHLSFLVRGRKPA